MKSDCRDTNVEVLRVLLMLGICLCHTIFAGVSHGMFGATEWLGGLVSGSVDGFVFISGWYGVRLKFWKLARLYSLAFFYWGASTVLIHCFDIVPPSAGCGVNSYWFLNAYAALMLLAPMINKSMQNKEDVLHVAIPIFVFVFIWGWIYEKGLIFGLIVPHVHGHESHSWVTLVGVYVVGRASRIYGVDKRLSKKFCFFGVLLLSAMAGFHYGILGGYNSVLVLAMAVCLFCFFKNLRVDNSKVMEVCRFLSPSLFAIYLIHQSSIGKALIHDASNMREWLAVPEIVSGMVFGIVVFILSFLLDLFRRVVVWCAQYSWRTVSRTCTRV